MKISLVGAEGSMGKRYQAILKYLGHEPVCFDRDDLPYEIREKSMFCSGIILATPTNTHAEYLLILEKCNKPILCEKPLSMNKHELKEIGWLSQRGMNLTMMMQYKFLLNPSSVGNSFYNYFRHGNDGLSWDCMQVIALAKGPVELKEDSPIWKCRLNGTDLSLSDMDQAYVTAVEEWIKNPGQDVNELISMHEKVAKYEEIHGLQTSS